MQAANAQASQPLDISALQASWQAFDTLAHLRPIYREADYDPKDALRFLLESRGLKQEDLSAIAPQGNLSAILAGKRKISARVAGKLGSFFGIGPAVFVPR